MPAKTEESTSASRRTKIICPGGYTWNNKGDAALVLSMLAELRRVAPSAELVVLSDSPTMDAREYGVAVFPPLFGGTLEPPARPAKAGIWQSANDFLRRHIGWRIRRWLNTGPAPTLQNHLDLWQERLRFHAFLAWLFIAIQLAGRASHRLMTGESRRVLRQFCEADLAVFVPGGYLIAPHAGHSYWFRHLAALFAARWLNMPVYLTPCTVGPFHGTHNRWLAKKALNHPIHAYLREESSFDALARIAPRSQREMGVDLGFLLPSSTPQRASALRAELLCDGRRALGVSVRDYRFPGHPNPQAQREHYLDAIATAVEHAVTQLGMAVYFVPQVLADELNDVSVAREVLSRVSNLEHVYLLDQDLDPRDLKGLYGGFDLFIGVRMHANIFALSAGVPTVAIAYEPKTEGIMNQLGLGEYAIGIRRLDSPGLIALLDRLAAEAPALRGHLTTAIPAMKQKAMRTADALHKALDA
jgi:colanic acid/amylovoran biosynthesis protein